MQEDGKKQERAAMLRHINLPGMNILYLNHKGGENNNWCEKINSANKEKMMREESQRLFPLGKYSWKQLYLF